MRYSYTSVDWQCGHARSAPMSPVQVCPWEQRQLRGIAIASRLATRSSRPGALRCSIIAERDNRDIPHRIRSVPMVHVAPSILAADFAKLGDEVAAVEQGGANRIHVDVMDGHFVPNLSMGPAIVKSLRPRTRLPLEVHLMITDPAQYAEPFLKAGADTILFHIEVLPDPRPLLRSIHSAGKKAGLVVNPETPVEALEPFLAEIELALCMTVHPGFGGQAFLRESPVRIHTLRKLIDRLNPACELEVDGGIDRTTAREAVAAGSNVLVAGTSIFRAAEGPAAAVKLLVG
ncbi:MAG: ribulose-phosphate 3-epimerase [Gemmataceae bacterium]